MSDWGEPYNSAAEEELRELKRVCSACGHKKAEHSEITGYCRGMSTGLQCMCHHWRDENE